MESNFIFVEDIHEETAQNLRNAEKKVRLNYDICNEVRNAFEGIIKNYIEEQGLESKVKKALKQYARDRRENPNNAISLFNKIKCLTNFDLCIKYGIASKAILPMLDKCEFKQWQNGGWETKSADKYYFLRKYGNTGSHAKGEIKDPIFLDYETGIKALEIMHEFIIKLYGLENIPPFNEQQMPIRDYIFTNSYSPSDRDVSCCELELKGYLGTESQNNEIIKNHVIVCVYDKKEMNDEFLKRSVEAFSQINDLPRLPAALVNMKVISEREAKNTSFYIVAYEFKREPQPFKPELFTIVSLKNRLAICRDLAEALETLHSMGVYHRMISYDSVYYVNWGSQGWIPGLVKYNFAKVNNSMLTCYQEASDAYHSCHNNPKKKKYNVEEHEWLGKNWEKIDIFSAGVLFGDIICGQVCTNVEKQFALMNDMDLGPGKEEVLDLLENMMSDAINTRPSMTEVAKIIRRCLELWK